MDVSQERLLNGVPSDELAKRIEFSTRRTQNGGISEHTGKTLLHTYLRLMRIRCFNRGGFFACLICLVALTTMTSGVCVNVSCGHFNSELTNGHAFFCTKCQMWPVCGQARSRTKQSDCKTKYGMMRFKKRMVKATSCEFSLIRLCELCILRKTKQ